LPNAGLGAKASRAIDIQEGDALNETAIKNLVRAAVALNAGKAKPRLNNRPKYRTWFQGEQKKI
jgi:hypothetical protein